jgi:lipid-binding SYLF domain-containing protein
MNAAGAKNLVQDSVKVGGEVSAAAGPVGRSSEGATDAQVMPRFSATRGREVCSRECHSTEPS